MAATQVTKQELQASRRWAIIHHVGVKVKPKDIENAVRQRVGQTWFKLNPGEPYPNNNTEVRRVYVAFNSQEGVDQLMNKRPLKIHQQTLMLSRSNPKKAAFSAQIVNTISIVICANEQKQITEHDLNQYFRRFGTITAYERLSDGKILVQFADYDSVDRIILHDLQHTISGTKVTIRKTREMITGDHASRMCRRCIHVTNLPADITGVELSSYFGVHTGNILIQPGNELNDHLVAADRSTSEAWIEDIGSEQASESLVTKTAGNRLCGWRIVCEVVDEPFDPSELCTENERGVCEYAAEVCYFKHRMCPAPHTCTNRNCWLGHSVRRPILSNPRNNSNKCLYRLRIGNVPRSTTAEQLMQRLDIPPIQIGSVRFPETDSPSPFMVVYLVHQSSERFLRNIIGEHHDQPFSPGVAKRLQLQLEKDVDFFRWTDTREISRAPRRSSLSSAASARSGSAAWGHHSRTASQTTSNSDLEENSPTESRVVHSDRPISSLEQMILERLAGLHLANCINNPRGVTLRRYVEQHPNNMHNALTITLDLLSIVKGIHSRNVVHRNITPDNIFVDDSIVLTDFASATFIQQTGQDQHPSVTEGCQPVASPDAFFCQTTTTTNDTSHVCAILFWLITRKHPKDSRDINGKAPHERKQARRAIAVAVEQATGTFTGAIKRDLLTEHLRLIFDRGFDEPAEQWPIDELEYQLRFALQFTKNNEESSDFPSPIPVTPTPMPTSQLKFSSFFRLAELIAEVKDQLQQLYPDILWQDNENHLWEGNDRQVTHHVTVVFPPPLNASVHIGWRVEIDVTHKARMTMNLQIKGTLTVSVPIGVCEQGVYECLRRCEMQLKNLFEILYEDRQQP